MNDLLNDSNPSLFIEEWLNHFNINYYKDFKLNNNIIDYYLDQYNVGVLIANWKKPISIKIVNKAVIILKELNLDEVYIIASDISYYANEVLDRIEEKVILLHPNGLSELAMKFAKVVRNEAIIEIG